MLGKFLDLCFYFISNQAYQIDSNINNLSDLEDVVALLLKENRRLQECLSESNDYIRGVNLQVFG